MSTMQAGYYPTNVTPRRIPLTYDMSYSYANPSQQQSNRPNIFHRRNERIDWRRVAAVDIDRMARDMDFQPLQDNLEQITFCNIDAEVDSRSMDPNFVKLYKMAQLTIEYLLLCQDQITTQMVDHDQTKGKVFAEQEEAHRHIEKLKSELLETKKESKKRRKMLETQQRMLMAQNSNYHTCPVCTHAFLSVAYLQAHMTRRHPDHDPIRRREHDVDAEKEIQRLKDELNRKDTDLQLIRVQRERDEEKIRDRETSIRQAKEENQSLNTKISILDDRLSQLRSNGYAQPSSSLQHETGFSELLHANKSLQIEIDQCKQSLYQSEANLAKEGKAKRRYQRDNENLQREIDSLKAHLQLLQSTSGDTNRLSQELLAAQHRYNEERAHREKLQEQLSKQPRDREHPAVVVPTPSDSSPAQTPAPIRPPPPIASTDVLLPTYCPRLVRRLDGNPNFKSKYRDLAKKQFVDELQDYENLGILDTETRLGDLDFRTKMESVLNIRRNIQQDLPDFERIRADINRRVDKLVNDRQDVRRSATSIRSAGSKLVTFQDEQKHATSTRDPASKASSTHRLPASTTSAILSNSKHDHILSHLARVPSSHHESAEDVTLSNADESDEDTQPTRPSIASHLQPSPRKNAPAARTTSAVSALAAANMRPTTNDRSSTVSALVRSSTTKAAIMTNKFDSDSASESEPHAASNGHALNVTDKKRIIEDKLRVSDAKGQKPSINAIAQGFRPSSSSLAGQPRADDDEESEPLTTLHTDQPPPVQPSALSHLPQLASRQLVTNNPLSSGDASQYTYDSLMKSNGGKGHVDIRRPTTADSTKTSHMDSDENLEGEQSN